MKTCISCPTVDLYDLPANTPKGWQCAGCKLWAHVAGNEPAGTTSAAPATLRSVVLIPPLKTITRIPQGSAISSADALIAYWNRKCVGLPVHKRAQPRDLYQESSGNGVTRFRIEWPDGTEYVEVLP